MYDGTNNEARLNREILCQELRENPPSWWDYSRCLCCAIEVGARLELSPGWVRGKGVYLPDLARAYGLSDKDVRLVFAEEKPDKTAAQVAAQLAAAPYV